MGGGKSIIDVKIAILSQGACKGGIILLLTRIEPDVFQQQDIASRHCGNRTCSVTPDAVRCKPDRAS